MRAGGRRAGRRVRQRGGFGRNPDDYVKPTIAVMKFENRASFPLGWNLGGGMQEVLVDRLMETNRYHVVERQELDSVMNEIQFQQSGATRPQGKAATGRIKNCQFLIKGVVTDFGHVSSKDAGVAFQRLRVALRVVEPGGHGHHPVRG